MPLSSISVTQPHSLGVAVAKERLKKLAEDSEHSDAFKLIDAGWVEATNTLTFTIAEYGTRVHGTLVIAADHVSVDTDPLPWFDTGFVLLARSIVKSKLAEALK